MTARTLLFSAIAVAILLPRAAKAVAPTAAEMAQARQWATVKFEGKQDMKATEAGQQGFGPEPFFSFAYDGKPSSELLKAWKCERASRELDNRKTEHTVIYSDAATGLTVRCVGIEYRDFPAVEWVLFFKNASDKDTPILSDIRAMDGGIPLARDRQAMVHYALGSECRFDDFAPQIAPLGPNRDVPQAPWVGESNPLRLQSKEGHSSCGMLPFFNVDAGTEGVICAIGWTGDWAAEIYRTKSEIRLRAGMPRTHLKLLGGEEIRSPRMVLLFWDTERMRGQNLWRQFVLAHHSPQRGGKPARVPICYGSWGANFAKNHIAHAKWCKDNALPFEFLWIDAGWYGNDEVKAGANVFNGKWPALVGDWFPNPGYFPEGLAPVGKALKDMNIGFLLWLEPERAFKGTTWTRQYPQYLLGPVGPNYLVDLGNPKARQTMTDFLVKFIKENHITCYRQDNNCPLRPFWDKADAPDRIGMTEIRHVTGLYQMWDDLLARCPGLLIDNCASGGRRIDLETMSRSIPLWRSDLQCFPGYSIAATQNQTHGLGLWAPLSSSVCERQDTYAFRSAMAPGIHIGMPDPPFDVDWLRRRLGELNQVRDLFLGDFYPLVAYSPSEDAWAAWQFDRPDLQAGAVFAFRRAESPLTDATLTLRGLDPGAVYTLTHFDRSASTEVTGKQLMVDGLPVALKDRPGAAVIAYKKKP